MTQIRPSCQTRDIIRNFLLLKALLWSIVRRRWRCAGWSRCMRRSREASWRRRCWWIGLTPPEHLYGLLRSRKPRVMWLTLMYKDAFGREEPQFILGNGGAIH